MLDQGDGKARRRRRGAGPPPDRPVSIAPVNRVTLAEELRLQLADEIVRGVLAPGMGLDETELARRFGVSRTPVREAIRLLAASGLVDARPHRSAVVARPSTERIVGMFEALKELEGLCSGLAAERMSGAERHELERLHDELAALVRAGDPQRYYEVNLTFHVAIYAGSHNEYLAELTEATRARIAPFSRAQFRGVGRLPKSHAEHQVVIEAILRGDRDGAVLAMRDHIETVREAYVDYSDSPCGGRPA